MAESCSVLHVDDDGDIRLIVEMALRLDDGMCVRSAANVDEALAIVQGAPGFRPGIILLDERIGSDTGIALLGRIRAMRRFACTPVIFLTARAMPKDVAAMIAAGALGVLTKPFNPLTLAREIRELVSSQATA